MRRIDDSLGFFLCKCLGWLLILKKYLFTRSRVINKEEVRTIFCQKYFGMGSILHAIPLIKALRENYPEARIIFMTLKSNQEVLELCKIADEILIVRIDSLNEFIKDVMKHAFYLLRKKIDISIDLEFFAKFSLLISFVTLARVRVGFHLKNIRPEGIITHKVYFNHHRHITEIFFAFAFTLGIERKDAYFTSPLLSFKNPFGKNLLKRHNIPEDSPIVVVNTNASDLFIYRRWPEEYYIELIEELIKVYPQYTYMMIGGNSEFDYVQNICNQIEHEDGQLINCASHTNLAELFGLIEMSFLMITNDSGPMHIASLYGANVAVFFGPETPILYGPLNKNSLVFYRNEQYCSPCISVYDSKKTLYGEDCGQNDCLLKIRPQEVFQKIEKRFFIPEINNE